MKQVLVGKSLSLMSWNKCQTTKKEIIKHVVVAKTFTS